MTETIALVSRWTPALRADYAAFEQAADADANANACEAVRAAHDAWWKSTLDRVQGVCDMAEVNRLRAILDEAVSERHRTREKMLTARDHFVAASEQ